MYGYSGFIMAMDRVEQRLRKVTRALDDAGIPYAVIGGNAVAAWVSRVDPAATRATKAVDLLVRREDHQRITDIMQSLGFDRHDLKRLVVFVDPDEPSRRSGVHLVWADTLIRPSYVSPSPSINESERDPEGFTVLSLPALVRMKLTFFRDIDRVHLADLVQVGLIDDAALNPLPSSLRTRMDDLMRTIEPEEDV